MATKKGGQGQQHPIGAPSSTLPNNPNQAASTTAPTSYSATTRGGMTANGSASALQFLQARWKAVGAAANDASLNASEKPEILREKAINPAIATATVSSNNPQQSKGNNNQQSRGGSAWGRKH